MTLAQELITLQHVEFTRLLPEAAWRPTDVLASLDVQRFNPTAPILGLVEDWIERAESRPARSRSRCARSWMLRAWRWRRRRRAKPTLDAVAQWSRSSSDTVTSINQRYDEQASGCNCLCRCMPVAGSQLHRAPGGGRAGARARGAEPRAATWVRTGSSRWHDRGRAAREGANKPFVQTEQAVLSNQKSFQAGSRPRSTC